MNTIHRLVLTFALLSINTMPAMDEDPVEQSFTQAIMAGELSPENLSVSALNPFRALVNKILVTTKLASGELVKLSPLLHAVYTQNTKLVGQLLSLGACPIGRLDTAPQLTTPLLEAIKLNNPQMILQLKDAAIAYTREQIPNAAQLSAELIKDSEDTAAKQGWYEKHQVQSIQDLYRPERTYKKDFAHAVTINDVIELQRLSKLDPMLVNGALIKTTLTSGDIVDISPLLYAVHTQNIPLILTLLQLPAIIPLGKLDSATQLSTPWQEACKSGNSVIVAMIRNAAREYLKETYTTQIALTGVGIDSQLSNLTATAHQVWGIDDQRRTQMIQVLHALRDQDTLLKLYTSQELEPILHLEDLVSTNNLMAQLADVRNQGIAEIIRLHSKDQ